MPSFIQLKECTSIYFSVFAIATIKLEAVDLSVFITSCYETNNKCFCALVFLMNFVFAHGSHP